ncbi:MAG TPA: kelch repeat-containing protein [Acidimicrobiales bacterium]|nr:kelch repeat-containing protein [Acidimicrobiales bacterium]
MARSLLATLVLGLPAVLAPPAQAQTTPQGSWERTGSLASPRNDHTLTLLGNGKVLAAGGRTQPAATVFNSAEVYDPVTEAWSPTGPMNDFRWEHTATLLADGRVLVAGGFGGASTGTGNNAQPVVNTAEIYNPATNTWTPTGSMSVRRALATAILLPNGQVLVAGGRWCPNAPPATCDFTFRTATAELYNPATGMWTPTASMTQARHTTASVLLGDGRVLVPAGFTDAGNGNNGDLYAGTWSATTNLNFARARQGAMLLQNGRVMVVAGFPATQTTEIYDPLLNAWSFAAPLTSTGNRFNYAYTVMPNGKVLIASGVAAGASVTNTDEYDPLSNTWAAQAPMNDPHASSSSLSNSYRAVVLSASTTSYVADPYVCGRNCGKVLVAGWNTTGSTELYTAAGTCYGFNATMVGTAVNDDLTGTAGRDVILGLGGIDRIAALEGDDVVCAGTGLDQVSGGAGADVLLGGPDTDSLTGGDDNDAVFGEVGDDGLVGGNGIDLADGWLGTDRCLTSETLRGCP